MGLSAEDMTARARIREVAMRHFAELGAHATTIRGVAKDAGVSPALVQHHFPTKQRLREACDEHALSVFRQITQRWQSVKQQWQSGSRPNTPAFLGDEYRAALPAMRYLSRCLVDGSSAAAAIFDDLVEVTEAPLRAEQPPRTSDPHAYAAVATAMQLGVYVLLDHLARALGVNAADPDDHVRINKAVLDIRSHNPYGPGLAELLRLGLGQDRQEDSR